jgi:hypothetical protein
MLKLRKFWANLEELVSLGLTTSNFQVEILHFLQI